MPAAAAGCLLLLIASCSAATDATHATTARASGRPRAPAGSVDAPSTGARGGLAAPTRVGDSWGTNIHWTTPPGGDAEAAMLAEAYKVARMDFHWADIETAKGVYNFSQYDALLAVMQAHGVRPYWILDYGNPLYPPAPPGPGAPNCSTPATCNATCPVVQKQPMRTCTADGKQPFCPTPGWKPVCPGLHAAPLSTSRSSQIAAPPPAGQP